MTVKDYYVVLGVPRDESSGGIRSAFRDLARRHHPDLAGPHGAPAFREVVEAYRVLSDPEARRQHDSELSGRSVLGERLAPLTGARARGDVHELRSLRERAETIRPSAEALFERVFRNFTGLGIPKAERPNPLFCDVCLSTAEALRGGLLPIRLPLRRPCSLCHGSGRTAFFPCGGCAAEGHVDREVVIPLRIPPGVESGRRVDVSLEHWGIRNLWLRVRIAVAP